MSNSDYRNLIIDWARFSDAFNRDEDYHDPYPRSAFLDLHSGDIIWVYDDDEDVELEAGITADENRRMREQINTASDRFLEIPGLGHGDHHDIRQTFVDSDWTDDIDALTNAMCVYYGPRSIGFWLQEVNDDNATKAYYNFKERKLTRLAEDYLRQNGIEPSLS